MRVKPNGRSRRDREDGGDDEIEGLFEDGNRRPPRREEVAVPLLVTVDDPISPNTLESAEAGRKKSRGRLGILRFGDEDVGCRRSSEKEREEGKSNGACFAARPCRQIEKVTEWADGRSLLSSLGDFFRRTSNGSMRGDFSVDWVGA